MQKIIIVFIMVICLSSVGGEIKAETLCSPPKKSTQELYQDIFVSLLSPHIDKAIRDYYIKDYNYIPNVYPYQVCIEKAERMGEYRSFEFLITMTVLPVVGPHIAVGEDRITFYINSGGKVELRKFEHLKDYELPDHWKDIKRKGSREF